MKKILFSFFTLVFAVGFTFAQINDANVTQNGSGSADVDQTNNSTNPGTDNVATVVQDGNSTVDIDQITNGGGNNNPITEATVNQTGDFNEATVDQNIKRNSFARITQTEGNAKATVTQRNASRGEDMEATVNQEGANEATVFQRDRNLRVTVNQINDQGASGMANVANVSQGDGGGVVGARAWVDQTGEANTIDLEQVNMSAPFSHRADLDQIGYGNSINLKQDGSAPASSNPGAGAEATILQQGDNNIVQGLGGNAQAFQGQNAKATINTYGDNNLVELEQGSSAVGNPNTATIMQGTMGAPSNGNTATVDQINATGATATITQN